MKTDKKKMTKAQEKAKTAIVIAVDEGRWADVHDLSACFAPKEGEAGK